MFAQEIAARRQLRLGCTRLGSPYPLQSSDMIQAGFAPSNSSCTPSFSTQIYMHPPCHATQTLFLQAANWLSRYSGCFELSPKKRSLFWGSESLFTKMHPNTPWPDCAAQEQLCTKDNRDTQNTERDTESRTSHLFPVFACDKE